MDFYSFSDSNDKIKRDSLQDNLYDLTEKTVVNTQELRLKIFLVPREMEMRLEKVSEHIYGVKSYVEELMAINDIINPYSIIEGQEIYFCDISQLSLLYQDDKLQIDDTQRLQLIASAQSNRDKRKIVGDELLPPTVKPKGLPQLQIDSTNKTISVMNSFE